jgi:HEAT repeat protein
VSRPAAVLAATLLAAAPSLANPPRGAAEVRRDAVERLLAGYEPHGSVADLRRLGPGVDDVLIEIAEDPRTQPLRRARALHALGWVPSVAGRDYLRATLRALAPPGRAPAGPAEVMALSACARALGRFGADAAPDLLALVAHPAADVRQAAAAALGESGALAARPALEQRLAVEPHPAVRAALARALAVLDGAPPR